jgi:hypothetical protein
MEILTHPADNFREANLFRPARRSSTEAWLGKTRRILLWLPSDLNWLVVLTILKNMKVNGKDYPIYEMENNPNVWNHQPVNYLNFISQWSTSMYF